MTEHSEGMVESVPLLMNMWKVRTAPIKSKEVRYEVVGEKP